MIRSMSPSSASGNEARRRLGRAVRARRLKLGLSISKAAERAGINRATWTGIEDGSRDTQDTKAAAVEAALGWAEGSWERILAGGEPVLAEEEAEAARRDRRRDQLLHHEDLLDRYDRATTQLAGDPMFREDVIRTLIEIAELRDELSGTSEQRDLG